MLNKTNIPLFDNIIRNLFHLYRNDLFSICAVAYFVFTWMICGNILSIFYYANITILTQQTNVLYLILYLIPIVMVVLSFYKELSNHTSFYVKILVIFNLLLFLTFAYAPPRNADSMRVWLAKVNDIILNGEKILRPYAHYNTPDAFTLFHLPVIQIGDGQLFQLSIFTCFLSILIILIKISESYGKILFVNLSTLLFIFNPFITLGATTIISDMPMILSFAGMIYSMIYYKKGNKSLAIILIFIFLAFGLNIKYNALMILPAFFYWLLTNIKIKDIKNYYIIFIIIAFSILNSIYPYLLNIIQIGNPVWPTLSKIFPSHMPGFDIAANYLTSSHLDGEKSISNFIISFYNLLTMPHHINPLIILLIPFLFQRFKYVSFMPLIIVCSYLLFLWIMMPRFGEGERERYVLYLFPIIIPFGVIGFSNIFKEKLNFFNRRILQILLFVPFSVYFAFNIFYSLASLKYLISKDKTQWHKYTWYYEDFNWINNNIVLKDDQQIMVYSSQQQTNYLRKRYINIDPLSGYFKNDKIFNSTSDYINEMKSFNIAYIFVDVDTTDGRSKSMFEKLVNSGNLIDMRRSRTFLGSLRILNKGSYHDTVLYRVKI